MIKSLNSGDQTGAQQAYAALTQAQSAGGRQIDPDSPLGNALGQIGQALQAGDLGGARQALSSLQQQARGCHRRIGFQPVPQCLTYVLAGSPPVDMTGVGREVADAA